MEITSRYRERENPSPSTSPNSNSNGGFYIQTPPLTPPPKTPISRSQSNPYPTTFIQADATTFKQVVQMLTGTPETAKQASKPPPPSKNPMPPIKNKQSFKLYERRNNLMISPLTRQNSRFSTRKADILSPSILDFPSLMLSPVTPLIKNPFGKSSPPLIGSSSEEEEKAIAKKGFYLHPSPRTTTPTGAEPLLLPLFP